MRAGFDIDDVKGSCVAALLAWHNRMYGTSLVREDITAYDLWNFFGCSQEESMRRVYQFYPSEEARAIKPIDGSQEGIADLARDFTLFSITSRPFIVEAQTREWVSSHFAGRFAEIIFTNGYSPEGEKETKAEICKKREIRVMVEDAPHTALECYNAGIPVVLLDAPWNRRAVLPSGIARAENWKDVVREIRRLSTL